MRLGPFALNTDSGHAYLTMLVLRCRKRLGQFGKPVPFRPEALLHAYAREPTT